MRAPPPLSDVVRYPVTAGVGALAIAVTAYWHSGRDIAPFVLDFHVWQGQFWRLFTSTLPHVNLLHLIFNLYWLWVFGSAIEGEFGQLRTVLLFSVFAVGSGLAEYAFARGGVGLSGVGYGLFGMLWVLCRRDNRFADVIDSQTAALFVGWFFLCIALTATGAWAVGNVAHGMGALQGALLGFALTAKRGNHAIITGIIALMAVVVAAATVGRPFVNFTTGPSDELAFTAHQELEAGRNESAALLLERAIRLNDREASSWYNLGIAYQRLGRESDMYAAYRRAVSIEPSDLGYKKALTENLASSAYQKQTAGEHEAAAELYREAVKLDPSNAVNWFNLGIASEKLGRREEAIAAYEKAADLAPDDARFREARDAIRIRAK